MDINGHDLRLLASLSVMLDERNVTRAATRLGISQPALSAQLARLRDIFGDQLLTPADIERESGAAGGHMFHGELAIDQLFVMRPLLGFARYGSPVPGLYLCGAGAHPGGFLSGQSGRLAAKRVIDDLM